MYAPRQLIGTPAAQVPVEKRDQTLMLCFFNDTLPIETLRTSTHSGDALTARLEARTTPQKLIHSAIPVHPSVHWFHTTSRSSKSGNFKQVTPKRETLP